jgi:hypothetical protein
MDDDPLSRIHNTNMAGTCHSSECETYHLPQGIAEAGDDDL